MWTDCLRENPLIIAVLVGLCGLGLVISSHLWPLEPCVESRPTEHEKTFEKHQRVLERFLQASVSGHVHTVESDGVGLALSRDARHGETLLAVPSALELSVTRTPSCDHDFGETSAACRIERRVVRDVAAGTVHRITGLLALLVAHRGLDDQGLVSDVLSLLPDVSWQADHGLFAVDPEEFRMVSKGTSMEGWRDRAVNDTIEALAYLTTLDMSVELPDIRWAYLILHSYGQWLHDDKDTGDLEVTHNVVYLWPLFLARPTPEPQDAVGLRFNPVSRQHEVFATRDMNAGEEMYFLDPRLTDASVLCFRGLWFANRHRVQLSLQVTAERDLAAQPLLDLYGCGAQPLRLRVTQDRGVERFLECMRMLALAGNASKLRHAQQRGWVPQHSYNRVSEAAAVEIAISSLQGALHSIGETSAELRQYFGGDSIAAHPALRVRTAETKAILDILKTMKDLQIVVSNEYLYEALQQAQNPSQSPRERASRESGSFRDES